MNKKEFIIKTIEQKIFDELKDASFWGVNYLKEKYQGMDINYTRLYVRIVNYQVKNYGRNLYESPINTYLPKKYKNWRR